MKTKWIVTVAATATIVLAAAIVLVIGIRNHTETGLVGACWTGAHVTRYEAEGANECQELVWPRESIPLSVYAMTDNPHPSNDPVSATKAAMRYINQMLGFKAFTWSGGGQPDVLVRIEVPLNSSWTCPGGHMWHERDATGRMFATVETSNVGDISTLNAVLIHELLHVLGLGHDDWEGSIMYVSIGSSDEGVPFRRLWITDHDRALLSSRYGQR